MSLEFFHAYFCWQSQYSTSLTAREDAEVASQTPESSRERTHGGSSAWFPSWTQPLTRASNDLRRIPPSPEKT